MRCSVRGVAAFALVSLAFGAFLVPSASAQIMGTFSWKPPRKVEEAMEKDRVPGIFVFVIPGEAAAYSLEWNFTQPQVMAVLRKHNFACAKIAVADSRSSRPWGSYQKLADEFGVSPVTTMVVVSYDRQVLASISQVIKRDEFVVFLGKIAAGHREYVKQSDIAAADLDQVEKWIEEKNYADAARRVKIVLDKERKIALKVGERAQQLDAKLETIGKERLAEGKRLLEAGKNDEAKAVLEEVTTAFSRYECAKEAKELLKQTG